MNVTQLLNDATILDKRRITLKGWLLIRPRAKPVIVDDYDSYDSSRFVVVEDNGAIRAHLQSVLPPYVGGTCLYFEECTIEGVLLVSNNTPVLTEISACALRRNETTVSIPLNTKSNKGS